MPAAAFNAAPNAIAPRKTAPLWIEIILAVLGVVCGGAITIAWLLLKPVAVVEHLPPPEAGQRDFGQVYYVKGSHDKARGASWVQKRQALLAAAITPAATGAAATPAATTLAPSRIITLNEDELNAWSASSVRVRQTRHASANANANANASAASQADADADAPVTVGLADFHIERGALQAAAPVTLRFLWLRAEVIVQARGTFARARTNGSDAGADTGAASSAANANLVMFSPDEIHAGSLPLHRIPGATAFLLREIFSNETLPGAGVSAWRRIESVKILGKELQITMSAAGP